MAYICFFLSPPACTGLPDRWSSRLFMATQIQACSLLGSSSFPLGSRHVDSQANVRSPTHYRNTTGSLKAGSPSQRASSPQAPTRRASHATRISHVLPSIPASA